MSYRRSRKYSAERLKRMQVVRDRTRMAEPAPDYPQPLPDLRLLNEGRAVYMSCWGQTHPPIAIGVDGDGRL